jgi:uncharacterized DUF497 family protein
MSDLEVVKNCVGFDWDEANELKNRDKHSVIKIEAEQVFFNMPLVVLGTYTTSDARRYLALGKTNSGRLLTVIFTIRKKNLIRVISARDMSRKERNAYDKIK